MRTEKATKPLIVHYTHDDRLAHNIKRLHQIWNKISNGTPIKETKFIIATTDNRNDDQELLSKRQIITTNTTRKP